MTSGHGGAPRPTVVVCTRNRRAVLEQCLRSLDEQVLVDDLEIVVVDNGSTDGTPPFLASWSVRAPASRRVVAETRPGLSLARNAGIDSATGDVVLFIDDDAVAPRGWVAAHLAAYRDAEVVAAGGPVTLTWPGGRPRWLTPALEHWYSALDLGDEPGPWPNSHGPNGTNMSVRRDAVVAVGGFATTLGRRGRSLISSEEADLSARLCENGGRIAYEPAALVLHGVLAERTSRRWVLRRGWAQGRSNARTRVRRRTMGWDQVVTVFREELAHATRDPRWVAGSVKYRDWSTFLDELARRAGHVSGALEQVVLWTRRDAGRGRRASPSIAHDGQPS